MAVAKMEEGLKTQILAELDRLGGKMFADEDIIFEGKKLVIPAGMNMSDAVLFLKRKIQEEEEITAFSRTYKFRPWDGAYCAYQAMKKAFGAVSHSGATGFFASPPQLIDIEVGFDHVEQIPWGTFGIPLLPDTEFTFGQAQDEEHGLVFTVSALGPKKRRFQIEGVFKLIEEELATGSIYRGKALDGKQMPSFLDLSKVDRSKVVYSETTQQQIDANVTSLLNYSQTMRDSGLPLKRAVLIHGPYGTGKTLAGFITAQDAVKNGWTFLYARPGRDDLIEVMQTARLYQPAVVFFEDVDVIANPDNAGEDGITALLDRFDGITAKGTEIIVVMTSNHPERIHKGMVRPGRLDAVIEVSFLDGLGVQQLIEVSVPDGLLAEKIDWGTVAASMDEFTPAFIKEAADRAFRYAIADNEGATEGITLTTENLALAAQSLRAQLDLMDGAKEVPARDTLGTVMEKLTDAVVEDVLERRVNPQVLLPADK